MSKVFISRPDGTVPWGFRLQGGFEYNEPLILTNIVPDSPADGKIDPGDMLIEIAGNNVAHMTHSDTLELIQRCGDALFLTLHKVDHSYPLGGNQMLTSAAEEPLPDYVQPPTVFVPPAPIFDADLIANASVSSKYQRPSIETITYEQTTDFSHLPAVLAKSLARPGPKPFTYIPGGLDLSKVLESARVRRHRDYRSNSQDTQDIEEIMSRRTTLPPEQMHQHHYAGVKPIQPFSYARHQPTPSPRKSIQHDTDVVTQSRAFQMLEGWISDSEKTIPTIIQSSQPPSRSAVARAVQDEQNSTDRRSSSGGLSSLPSRSFRYLQEQYSTDDNTTATIRPTTEDTITSTYNGGLRRSSDSHTPSRSFKFLQDQYHVSDQLPVNRSRTVNNRDDLIEIYNKPPPSFRAREPEAPRYTGSTVPSRSFRFLQMMTQDDQQNSSTPIAGYTKPQQSLYKKYDEHNLSLNTNRLNEHPSRSFKYLQTMTGEQPSTGIETGRRIHSVSNEINSTNIGASDF